MTSGFNKTFALEIVDRVLLSWWTLVAAVCVGGAVAIIAVHVLPKTYEASTKIFVTPQRIPQDYVRTTVVDDLSLRIAALEQAVLSRPYMLRIIKDSFQPAPRDEGAVERLLAAIRARIDVRIARGVFEISFRDRDPERAARVVNALADIYIDENSKFRAERAEETTKTLQNLAARVRGDLEKQERKIAEFKAAHLYETADRQTANLQLLQAAQRDLEIKEKALALARERIRALDEWDAQASWMPAPKTPAGGAAKADSPRVAQLRRDIEALKLRYADGHPEVRAKQRELEDALAAQDVEEKKGSSAVHLDEADIALGRKDDAPGEQKAAAATEIRLLQLDVNRIKEAVALYRGRIEATPIVEQQLAELTKGYDVLSDQYKNYQSKVEQAKSSQEIEETRKGEQFEVIERAVPPALPAFPNPWIVLGLGLALGAAVFVGPVVVREAFVPRVRSEAGLRALTELPLLVTIPRLEVPAVVAASRRRRVVNWGISALSLLILFATVAVLV